METSIIFISSGIQSLLVLDMHIVEVSRVFREELVYNHVYMTGIMQRYIVAIQLSGYFTLLLILSQISQINADLSKLAY